MNQSTTPDPAGPKLSVKALRRVLMTTGCHDCDDLPKVPHAGQIVSDENSRYQIMHNGLQVLEGGYCGQWMTEIIRRLQGHHEPQEERVFHELLAHIPTGSTMVELGSGWGFYSMWFAREVADAHLVCVEPDPVNLKMGEQNFRRNGVTGQFVQASVGSRSLPPRPFSCESGPPIDTPEISVDDLIAREGLSSIELLLADIQGAELSMLKGAARAIAAGKVRFVVVATHHHSISRDPLIHQRCLAWIQDHGGHVLSEFNVVEGFAGDGMIAASFCPEDRTLPMIPVSRNRPSNTLFRGWKYKLTAVWAKLRGHQQWSAWLPWGNTSSRAA